MLPGIDAVMVGDSITAAGPWQTMFPNVRVVNKAVSGFTTYDTLREMKSILALKPKKAFVMIGINDLMRQGSVRQTFDNIMLIVKQLQQNNIAVYIQATLECSRDRCGSIVQSVRDLTQRLKAAAEASQIPFIDLNPALTGMSQGLLPAYTADGLHLLAPAYVIWGDALKPYIQ